MKLKNRVYVPGIVAAFSVAATSAMAQVGEIPSRNGFYEHGHDMMWGGNQWGGFGMIVGPIFMILIVVGIVVGIIYLLGLSGTRTLFENSCGARPSPVGSQGTLCQR